MRLKLPLLSKALAAAALACAVLAPTGAAGSTSAQIKMAVVPLPKSVIGPAATPLQLSQFSGVVSNDQAADLTLNFSGWNLMGWGRVSGYMLDYGHAASGGSGITNVRTSVERYKTPAKAKNVFGYLKWEDAVGLGRDLSNGLLTVKSTRVKVPALGKARFAYLTTYTAANIVPFATLDERILEGKYVLQAQVSAGTGAAAKALAPKLAKKLDARFRLALQGRLHAKPVQLPAKQTAGPPVGGPDLAAFALRPSDVGGEATLHFAGYSGSSACGCGGGFPFPHYELSRYEVEMGPPPQEVGWPLLFHQIEWYATANEAAFRTDKSMAQAVGEALDLSSVGHGVQAVTCHTGCYGVKVMLNVGRLAEVLEVTSDRPIQTSDVLPIVQTAANRIDAVYTP